jgi:hypothetical protein
MEGMRNYCEKCKTAQPYTGMYPYKVAFDKWVEDGCSVPDRKPETQTESLKRFNDELGKIKVTISPDEPHALSEIYTARTMPHTFVGFMDRMVSYSVGKDEDEAVLADRVLDAMDVHIEKLMIERRLLKRYIRERYDDDDENPAHCEV